MRAPSPRATPRMPFRDPGTGAGVFACYLAASLLLFGRVSGWGCQLLSGSGGDSWSFVWFLHWWPWALAHGRSLLHTGYLYAPLGYDLPWATPVPTAALMALPVTLLFGAVVSFNVLGVMAPALGAFSAFLLLRRGLGAGLAASAGGGALFGFSPFESGQLLGHLNLDLDFPVPLVCLLAVLRVRGRVGAGRYVVVQAILLLAEFGLSAETFATCCSLGILVWLLFLLFGPAALRRPLLRLGRDSSAALALVALAASPFLVVMVRGANEIGGFVNAPWQYSTNLLNLVVPTRLTAVGGNWLAPVTERFDGNLSEQDGYLGLPLLLVLVLLARERGRERLVACLLLATGGAVLASLGPSLHVGRWDTRLPLPWWLATHLPLLRAALPARLALYAVLGAAVAAAIWCDGGRGSAARGRRFALLALCLVCFLPARDVRRWSPAPFLPFFAPDRIAALLPPPVAAAGGGAAVPNLLVLPFLLTDRGTPSASMFWQWQAGMRFRQAGGYLSFVPSPLDRQNFVQHLMHAEPTTWFANDLAAFCAAEQVAAVVAGPGTSATLLRALLATGWRAETTGGATLLRVPEAAALRYASLSGDAWFAFGDWSWLGRVAVVTTHGRGAVLHLSSVGLPVPAMTVAVQAEGGEPPRRFALPANGTVAIPLPPDGRYRIMPGASFLPRLAFGSRDPRVLSVLGSLEPVP